MRASHPALSALAGLLLAACESAPPPPQPQITLTLRDAMIQTVDALAVARGHAASLGRGRVRACGAEVVFHVIPVPVQPSPEAPVAAQLAITPPDGVEGPHSNTVTLTLAGEDCDEPTEPTRRGHGASR